jgi:hypothetical protein
MKITYHGSAAVDIDGHDDVQPEATVEVPEAQGAQLCLAGCSFDTEGNIVAHPDKPLWTEAAKAKAPAPTTSAPVAGEED